MFGFLKNLLRRTPETPAESTPYYAPEPAPADPVSYAAAPVAPRRNIVHQNGRGVELPLHKILCGLPLELQPRIKQPDVGDTTVSVPLEKVLAQLSRGAVKISFGELRAAFPDVFTLENDRDRVLIALPLDDILARLNPALITRRRAQRQVQVPQEITSPFDSRGHETFAPNEAVFNSVPDIVPDSIPAFAPPRRGSLTPHAPIAPSRHTLDSIPTPPAPVALPLAPAARQTISSVPPLPPPAATPPAIPFRPRPIVAPPASPIEPAVAPEPIAPLAAEPPPTPPATPVPPTAPAPMAPPPPPTSVMGLAARTLRDFNGTHQAPVAPASVPEPTRPEPEALPLIIGLSSLAETWPESVRREVVALNLVEAKVALPASAIEMALKQGRIAFSWKTVRSWIKPSILPTVSAHDSAVLEMPLKVVAPLFLERQREAAKARSKVAVDADIPDLFFGLPQPASGDLALAPHRPTDTNYYVWGDTADTVQLTEAEVERGPSPGTKFVAKYATPNEVVSRAAVLDGVAGALIALPDGLMVASKLSSDLNGDTLAAFLPQIFGKVSVCTKELRMGELNNLNFTVGNVPWKIFRVNAIFFAAFGRTGQPLPTAQLAALAAELDHRAK